MYVALILGVLLLKENIGDSQLIIRYQHINVSKQVSDQKKIKKGTFSK